MYTVSPALHRRDSLSANVLYLFAAEGALFQFISTINSFANNLFATSLGATDTQIGLVQTVPNVAAVLLLIPLGLLANRLRSSRTIPLMSLLCVAAGYFMMAAVPTLGSFRLIGFFIALAFTVGGPALYNAQWQNFFGDVVLPEQQNAVLAQRNRAMFALGILAPLACSVAYRRWGGSTGVFQAIFAVCGIAMLIQAGVLSFIHPLRSDSASISASDSAWKPLFRSRDFLMFFIPITLFHMIWQIDWSIWYIGQTQYLKLTEAQISAYTGIFNIGQLFAVDIVAKQVMRKGPDKLLPLALVGPMGCMAALLICTTLPMSARMPVFSVLGTVLGAPQCALNLCAVPILLRTAPKGCRSMAVSLYTLTMTLSNCFMPYLGVKIYTALGADYRALLIFYLCLFILRLPVLYLLMRRCPK